MSVLEFSSLCPEVEGAHLRSDVPELVDCGVDNLGCRTDALDQRGCLTCHDSAVFRIPIVHGAPQGGSGEVAHLVCDLRDRMVELEVFHPVGEGVPELPAWLHERFCRDARTHVAGIHDCLLGGRRDCALFGAQEGGSHLDAFGSQRDGCCHHPLLVRDPRCDQAHEEGIHVQDGIRGRGAPGPVLRGIRPEVRRGADLCLRLVPGKSIDLTIRRVGRVTNEVFESYVGQKLFLRGPFGNGFDVSLYQTGEVVVVAGGTGVSPVCGVIDSLATSPDPESKYVIVGFKSLDDMLFRDDLARWDKALSLTLTVDGAHEGYEGNIGLVTKCIPDLPLKDPKTAQAVVVGPPPMMRFTIKGLLELGFAEENIWVSQERRMCCGLGKCGHCRIGERYVCLDGPVFNYTVSKDMLD